MKSFDKIVLSDELELFNMGTIIEVIATSNKRNREGYEITGLMSQIICCVTMRDAIIEDEVVEVQEDGTLYADNFGEINFCPSCGKKIWLKVRMVEK